MQAWLAKSGLDVKALGLFGLVMFPYTFKFLWAPFMDRYTVLPLGRRRGWMALTQLALRLYRRLGMLDPLELIAAVFLIAFLSASQDVVIDAYRREILAEEEQGWARHHRQRLQGASLIPGAGSVMADSQPWQWCSGSWPPSCCRAWSARCWPRAGAVRRAAEDLRKRWCCRSANSSSAMAGAGAVHHRLRAAVQNRRHHGHRAVDQVLPRYRFLHQADRPGRQRHRLVGQPGRRRGGRHLDDQAGHQPRAVGVRRAAGDGHPRLRWLAQVGRILLLSAVFGFEAFASLGLGSAALVAFMSRATDPRYTATQYALFSSLAAVPRTFINSSVGYIVAETGWFWFFIVCFILAFPAMMMLPKIAPWNSGHEKP
jgi:PAT family beta-lactamase induction signal transducer AmpG